ncbi:MAG TPA: 4Fe-4S dicluster domain-containing protein [Desulfobacteraceae bacterium]|nr:4Fe-4S dicluster domain-containing protein [Deltaproteobacteria bacterium]MBW2355274.1 4Fe-4S dicluster domain-containing protein [Deltaproteobacteria bacterium]HDI59081.1 4Fe-4S dicluster domain-containing protein [Desulfobacteraceae bacterium]
MFRRSLFRTSPPRFFYQTLTNEVTVALTAAGRRMILFCDHPLTRTDHLRLKVGDPVTAGQRIVPFSDASAYVVAPAAGRIQAVSPFAGDFGKSWTRIDLAVEDSGEVDPGFAAAAEQVSMETVRHWMSGLPGGLDLEAISGKEAPIETVVVAATESDLLTVSAQYVLRHRTRDVRQGIEALRQITGAQRVILAVGRDTVQGMGHVHAEVRGVSTVYPASAPGLMLREILGREVPSGTSTAKIGIAVVPVEAVAALGRSFAEKRLAMQKVVTVVDKSGRQSLFEVTVGTPVADLLATLEIQLETGDRLIAGGPMTGMCLYTDDYPVRPDTHCLMVQDAAAVGRVGSDPCINCGECVRICPARVPVNMLVRFLEAGEYETAAAEYDLFSCVDCGLCACVCPARIPIFQYLRLAKYELAVSRAAEAENA